jgi:hypothetical protein
MAAPGILTGSMLIGGARRESETRFRRVIQSFGFDLLTGNAIFRSCAL